MNTEILNSVPTVLNLVAFYIYKESKDLDKSFHTTMMTIEDEFEHNFKELANVMSSENIDEGHLINSISGIRKIHFASIKDYIKIHFIKKFIKWEVNIAFSGLLIAIISRIIGSFFQKGTTWFSIDNIFIIAIPVIIFFIELFLLLKQSRVQKYLSKIQHEYNKRRYF